MVKKLSLTKILLESSKRTETDLRQRADLRNDQWVNDPEDPTKTPEQFYKYWDISPEELEQIRAGASDDRLISLDPKFAKKINKVGDIEDFGADIEKTFGPMDRDGFRVGDIDESPKDAIYRAQQPGFKASEETRDKNFQRSGVDQSAFADFEDEDEDFDGAGEEREWERRHRETGSKPGVPFFNYDKKPAVDFFEPSKPNVQQQQSLPPSNPQMSISQMLNLAKQSNLARPPRRERRPQAQPDKTIPPLRRK